MMEGVPAEKGPDQESAERAAELLSRGLTLDDIPLTSHEGGERRTSRDIGYDYAAVPNGTYNWANGAIVAKHEGKVVALPGTGENAAILDAAYFRRDEGLGVPNLNSADGWVVPSGEDFRRWRQMVEEAQAREARDAA
jgi:hypothetical protein